jgi:hypothetical protein
MSGFRDDGVLASAPPEVKTFENVWRVRVISEAPDAETAIEEQQDMLDSMCYSAELIERF